MIQWCRNRVIFYADRETRRKLASLFRGLEMTEQKGYEQLVPFLKDAQMPFRNIRWSDEEEVVYYETPQLPTLDELIELANFYGCPFECTYRLPLRKEYYRVLYRDGKLSGPSEAEPIEDTTELTVRDIEGNVKVITDLDSALALAEEFMGYRPIEGRPTAFDKRMCAYWADLYSKLKALKEDNHNNKKQ